MGKDQNQKDTVNKKLEAWYENTVVDDRDDNNTIAEVCIRECYDKFNIGLGDAATVLAFYAHTLDAITDELKTLQEKKTEAELHIDDIFAIGYDNLEDDDTEKQGNFSPYMYDLGGRFEFTRDPDANSVENCTRWMTMKLKDYPKLWDSVATKTITSLNNDCNIPISQSCVILPIFALIQSQLCQYMDVKRKDSGENEIRITFAGSVDVYARKTENGDTSIEFKPMPSTKLGIKSDSKATQIHEDED